MIKREIKIFFTALGFFSRIPCPAYEFKKEYLHEANRYFAIIGLIIGLTCFATCLFAMQYLSLISAIFITLIISVIITGALHEDGLADMIDGLGGGWTAEQKLAIMKDSSIGTYGAIALLLLLGLKVSLLHEALTILNQDLWLIFFLAIHSLSRFSASSLMLLLPYIRAPENSKSAKLTKVSKISFLTLTISGVAPLFFLQKEFSLVLIPLLAATGIMKATLSKQIGGITGDCIGGCQQINELVCIASFIIIANNLIV